MVKATELNGWWNSQRGRLTRMLPHPNLKEEGVRMERVMKMKGGGDSYDTRDYGDDK